MHWFPFFRCVPSSGIAGSLYFSKWFYNLHSQRHCANNFIIMCFYQTCNCIFVSCSNTKGLENGLGIYCVKWFLASYDLHWLFNPSENYDHSSFHEPYKSYQYSHKKLGYFQKRGTKQSIFYHFFLRVKSSIRALFPVKSHF
jgi:hypothetical protein